MEFFERLGRRVDDEWGAVGYRDDALAGLAERALVDEPPFQHVDLESIIAWSLRTDPLPYQHDLAASFGQPPISLFASDRILIQALFWLDGTTSIHEHNFTGAFSLLTGASLHALWRFDLREQISPDLVFGRLDVDQVELLAPGDVRRVLPGADLIHSLFHLDQPSVTIIVRSCGLTAGRPQYRYHRPGIGIDRFDRPMTETRQLQVLRMLARLGDSSFETHLRTYVERVDLAAAVRAFLDVSAELTGIGRLRTSLDAAIATQGAVAEEIAPVLVEAQRLWSLVNRRQSVADETLRFFLGLLLNLPDRDTIVAMVRARFPDRSPARAIAGWVVDLGELSKRPGAEESSSLSPAGAWVLEKLLDSQTESEILATVAAGDAPAHLAVSSGDVERTCFLLPLTKSLRPLFS